MTKYTILCKNCNAQIIYEEKGDYPMAETYYLKVFEVTEESYGARLRYTARQGIKRLKTAKATQD